MLFGKTQAIISHNFTSKTQLEPFMFYINTQRTDNYLKHL